MGVPSEEFANKRTEMEPEQPFTLGGNALELIIAPCDVLVVSSGHGAFSGAMDGVMGHVLLIASPPRSIKRRCKEAKQFGKIWPQDGPEELWLVCTVESTRQKRGLHKANTLIYVHPTTRRLIMFAEVHDSGALIVFPNSVEVELWQCPNKLRTRPNHALMANVLRDMKANEADWSGLTAARAVMQSSSVVAERTPELTMEKIRACWVGEPICTSVVIIFWQRYLCKLVNDERNGSEIESDLILKWMPLMADRVLPGEMLSKLREVGWTSMISVPTLFRPTICGATFKRNTLEVLPQMQRILAC